jgi:NitT/TauT family transport system substrate-binding protein
MALHRRSFLKLAGIAGTGSAFGVCAPAIVRAATAIKLTLPWLPLGTYSFTFAAKKLGYWEKRGLDVTIDRGFGSTKVCVPVDQGQYDFGLLDMAVQAGCDRRSASSRSRNSTSPSRSSSRASRSASTSAAASSSFGRPS